MCVEFIWIKLQILLAVLNSDGDYLLLLLPQAEPEMVLGRLSEHLCLGVSVNDKIPSLDYLLDGLIEEGVPGFGVFVLEDEELVAVEAVFQGVA